MTFGGTFFKINLDSLIIDVIRLTNLIFLALNSGSHIKYKMITFNDRIDDGQIEFPICKSNVQSTQLKTEVK